MDHFKVIGDRLSNWKRWGADDQRGTLNFITPDKVVTASRCVKTGRLFELSIPLGADGPQTGLGGRVNPLHFLTVMPTDDLKLGDGLNAIIKRGHSRRYLHQASLSGAPCASMY